MLQLNQYKGQQPGKVQGWQGREQRKHSEGIKRERINGTELLDGSECAAYTLTEANTSFPSVCFSA